MLDNTKEVFNKKMILNFVKEMLLSAIFKLNGVKNQNNSNGLGVL